MHHHVNPLFRLLGEKNPLFKTEGGGEIWYTEIQERHYYNPAPPYGELQSSPTISHPYSGLPLNNPASVEEINLFLRFLDQKSQDDDDQTEVEEDELSSTMIIVLCVTSFAAIVLIWVTIMVIVWFKRWSAKNTAEHAQAGIPRRPKAFKL